LDGSKNPLRIEPYQKLTGEERASLAAELAAFYQRGDSIRALMARTGRSYGAIHRLLTIDAGITLRPRGGANNPHGGHGTRIAG
jgi:hypothetical protein